MRVSDGFVIIPAIATGRIDLYIWSAEMVRKSGLRSAE